MSTTSAGHKQMPTPPTISRPEVLRLLQELRDSWQEEGDRWTVEAYRLLINSFVESIDRLVPEINQLED